LVRFFGTFFILLFLRLVIWRLFALLLAIKLGVFNNLLHSGVATRINADSRSTFDQCIHISTSLRIRLHICLSISLRISVVLFLGGNHSLTFLAFFLNFELPSSLTNSSFNCFFNSIFFLSGDTVLSALRSPYFPFFNSIFLSFDQLSFYLAGEQWRTVEEMCFKRLLYFCALFAHA
jgi:hypothetical protein